MRMSLVVLAGLCAAISGCQMIGRPEPSLGFMTGTGKFVGGPETAEGRRLVRAQLACAAEVRTTIPGKADYLYARLARPISPGMTRDPEVGPLTNALLQCMAGKKYQAIEIVPVQSRSSG